MRAFASRWSCGFSSSLFSHVSGVRLVSSTTVKLLNGTLCCATTSSITTRAHGTVAKNVDVRSSEPMYIVESFSIGDSHTVLVGGGVTAHIDESSGKITLVGEESKVTKLVELLDQGYFATFKRTEERLPEIPPEAQFTTASVRCHTATSRILFSCVPSPLVTVIKCKCASKSEKEQCIGVMPVKSSSSLCSGAAALPTIAKFVSGSVQ